MLAFFLRNHILAGLGWALVENEPPRQADCILVLGGDQFGERILTAAQLAKSGYAPYILVDTMPDPLTDNQADNTTIRVAVRRGYPANLFRSVLLPDGVDSTYTEARYLGAKILKPAGIHRILLVTSNFHTRRAGRFMRRVNPWLGVTVVAAPDRFFTPGGWWMNRNGRKTFLLEWTKTITEMWGG